MDFSSLALISLAAIITGCWIIGTAVLSKRGVGFGPPFLITYVLGVIFAEPWRIASWQELWMFAVMFLMLALWVAAGCIIGGVPAVLAVWIGAKLRQRLER
jgi:hypothetical protein